jgi:hypothetical protein
MVPLPDNDVIAIKYESLIGYEQMGIDDYTVGELRKTYSVKKLLNGIEKEEERRMKTEGGDKINIDIHDLVVDSGKSEVHVEQKTDVVQKTNINMVLRVDLPIIQSEFREFKREVTNLDEKLDEELVDLEDDLLEITPASEEGKVNKAINKLSFFMHKLKDEDSRFSRIVKGTKKGMELAQKLAVTYNKFAQALGLDPVQDLFL